MQSCTSTTADAGGKKKAMTDVDKSVPSLPAPSYGHLQREGASVFCIKGVGLAASLLFGTSDACSPRHISFIVRPQWGTTDAEINIPSAEKAKAINDSPF